MRPRKLEEYKYFQPIAWTIMLTFAGFVAVLSLQLNQAMQSIEQSSIETNMRIDKLEKTITVPDA